MHERERERRKGANSYSGTNKKQSIDLLWVFSHLHYRITTVLAPRISLLPFDSIVESKKHWLFEVETREKTQMQMNCFMLFHPKTVCLPHACPNFTITIS